jgi:5-methylcytosine-specific restriction endonuclease McrA
MAKKFAKAFYNSKEWLECRAAYIKSVLGLCEDCRNKGIAKPGYIVHHRTELTPDNINDPMITLNWDNLRYLCLDCHNRVNNNAVTRDDVIFDSNGQLVKR